MNDRSRQTSALALGLAGLALVLLFLPLLINIVRGGAEGVGVDPRTDGSDLRFAISYAETAGVGPLRGRIFLIVSRTAEPEPRLQDPGQTYVFGRAVDGWMPRRVVELTDQDPGAPLPSIAHIPASHYWVQAVLDVGDPSGEGQLPFQQRLGGDWSRRPGNLVSRPVELFIDPRSDDILRVYLAGRIAP